MLIQRRSFLKMGALTSAALLLPRFLKAFESGTPLPRSNRVLVIIQLTGGNDGLNTIIPITNDLYHTARPTLRMRTGETLSLTPDAGLHPALPFFKNCYDAGELAVLNNVGYPQPDKSHFRSMDIWQSASASTEYLQTGWIGRYLDAVCHNCDHPTQALELDSMLSLAMKGEAKKALAVKDPQRLYRTTREPLFQQLQKAHRHTDETADYLYQTLGNTLSNADYIFKESKVRPTTQTYPATALGKDLKQVASLIGSDINTQVYYLSIGSFDTHSGQAGRQKTLFTQLNDAVEAFVKDLKDQSRFEDVLLMTFSEFGRRVAQNASSGTDHGTANQMFFMSGALAQKGLLNPLPDLKNLADGDLIFTEDFRDVYATVLRKWLQADPTRILGGQRRMYDFV
ncbi:MAG: DUF1501 domain-containing protein [Sphingobacteriales bacterium]|nr:MAG: DUF1501 domain-containing protein [Sphingobacteriales bacterium]